MPVGFTAIPGFARAATACRMLGFPLRTFAPHGADGTRMDLTHAGIPAHIHDTIAAGWEPNVLGALAWPLEASVDLAVRHGRTVCTGHERVWLLMRSVPCVDVVWSAVLHCVGRRKNDSRMVR